MRVQPKASRNRVRVESDGQIRIYVTAPPTDGAANAAVCELLAKHLGLGKSAVRIVQGARGRDKQISVSGIPLESVLDRLRSASS